MAQRGRPRKNHLLEAQVEQVEPIAEAPEGDVFVRILWAHVGIEHGRKAYRGEELSVSPELAEMLVARGAAEYA